MIPAGFGRKGRAPCRSSPAPIQLRNREVDGAALRLQELLDAAAPPWRRDQAHPWTFSFVASRIIGATFAPRSSIDRCIASVSSIAELIWNVSREMPPSASLARAIARGDGLRVADQERAMGPHIASKRARVAATSLAHGRSR